MNYKLFDFQVMSTVEPIIYGNIYKIIQIVFFININRSPNNKNSRKDCF